MAERASGVPAGLDRGVRLLVGVFLGAVGYALTLRANLGLGPWHVLQQGLAEQLEVSIGTASILVNVALLVAAIALRERPGVGTVAATTLGGVFLDAVLPALGHPHGTPAEVAALVAGLVVMSFGGALYMSALLGSSPLDAVMTGVYRWTPLSLHNARLGLEIAGLTLGWWAGGTVGIGSAVIGLGIGPALHAWLHLLRSVPEKAPTANFA